MVCCHVCFHKTKPEASYVRALRRDCTHSARTLPARTLPLLLFTEVPRRGVLRASPARSFSEVSREQRLGAFARRTERGRAPNLKGYPYSGRDRAGAGTRPHLTRHADERFTTRPRRRPIHRRSGKRRSLDLASDGFSELRLYRVLGTSVARLFPAVLGDQRAGTPKETGAPYGRPRFPLVCLLCVGVELTAKRCAPGRPSAPPSRKLSARPRPPQRSARREDRQLRPVRSR